MVSRIMLNMVPSRLSNQLRVVLCSGKFRFAEVGLIHPFGAKRVSGNINIFGKSLKVELDDEGDAIHFHEMGIGVQFSGFSKESTEENMIPTIELSFSSDASYRIVAIPTDLADSHT